jgi:hypothetical protein
MMNIAYDLAIEVSIAIFERGRFDKRVNRYAAVSRELHAICQGYFGVS